MWLFRSQGLEIYEKLLQRLPDTFHVKFHLAFHGRFLQGRRVVSLINSYSHLLASNCLWFWVPAHQQTTGLSSTFPFLVYLLLLWHLPKDFPLPFASPNQPMRNQFGKLITGSTPQAYLLKQTVDWKECRSWLGLPSPRLVLLWYCDFLHLKTHGEHRSSVSSTCNPERRPFISCIVDGTVQPGPFILSHSIKDRACAWPAYKPILNANLMNEY